MGERRGVMHFTVLGKGSKTRYVPVHPAALSAINDYLAAAGHGEDRAGPLFRPVRNNVTGTLENAMTGGGIYDMVRRYGRQAGITVDGSAFTPCAPRSAQTPSNTKLTSPTCRCGSAMPIYKHHAPL
jgi:integrase